MVDIIMHKYKYSVDHKKFDLLVHCGSSKGA